MAASYQHHINILYQQVYHFNINIYAFPETVFLCCDLNIWSIDKKKVLKSVFHRLSNGVLNDKIHGLPNFGVRTYGIFKKQDFEM